MYLYITNRKNNAYYIVDFTRNSDSFLICNYLSYAFSTSLSISTCFYLGLQSDNDCDLCAGIGDNCFPVSQEATHTKQVYTCVIMFTKLAMW